MKTIYFFAVLFLIASCSPSAQESTTSTEEEAMIYKVLSSQEFKDKHAAGGESHLLDVRTPEEVAQGQIAGATNINFYDDNFEEQITGLDKNKPVFVYCKSGGRSGKASALFQKLGFKEIYDLKGGYTAWASEIK